MKAILLTYAPVTKDEEELIRNTDIFKIALNNHAEEMKPDIRICSDYILNDLLTHFPQNVISVREKLRYYSKRVIYPEFEFKGSTIVSGVDWLIENGYKDILIVGDNKVNTPAFQNIVSKNLFTLLFTPDVHIFQYTNGNFLLPVMSVEQFIKGDADGV